MAMLGMIPGVVVVESGEPALVDWLDGGPSVFMEVEMKPVMESDRASVVAMEGASVVDPRVSPGVMARLLVEPLRVVPGVVSAVVSVLEPTISPGVVPWVGVGMGAVSEGGC